MIELTKKNGFICWATLLVWSTVAGGSFLQAQQLNLAFHRLDRDKGLSQGTCPFVSRDSKGFVWIATTDGLNRFDGQHVRVYRPNPSEPHSLVGNFITSSCYEDDKTGDLWFTTYNALHRYVRAYDHFDTFQLQSPAHKRLVEDYYAFHLDRQGRLWLRVGSGDEGYLHLFDTRTGRDSIVCPLVGQRSVVVPDKAGRVRQVLCSQFNAPGLEIVDLTGGAAQRTRYEEGLFSSAVHEAFVENDTLIWLGLSDGIAAFNPQNGTSRRYAGFASDPAGDVWSVYPYGKRRLFVATEKKGLWVFDRLLLQFTQRFVHEPDNPLSLMDNETKNLYVDRQENLWVGHWKYGLSHVNLRKSKFLIPPATRGHSFWQCFKGPDGNIWCSEPETGFFVYTQEGQPLDTIDNNFPEIKRRLGFKSRLYFPDGEALGFYLNYLLKWDGAKRRLHLVRKLPLKIVDMCAASGGKTIVATAQGLFRPVWTAADTFSFNPIALQTPAPLLNIGAIFCDSRGYVYVSSNAERLFVFKETREGLEFKKSIAGVGECKGFYEIAGGQGLWVAGSSGLLRIGPGFDTRIFNETSDGLPNAMYYGVIPDRRGRLWLSSNQGLLCYDTVQRDCRRYLPVDGLFGAEFNTGAFFRAADGRIWAGGFGGLAVFHPDSIRNVPFEPQVQMTRVLANDEPLETGRQTEVLESLDLPYAQNTLSFEFVALEFSNPKANQYQYRLVGYDDHWVKSGNRGFARYPNLPPGHYTFEVLAANSDGVWSTVPKSLSIHIQTPFYKTWWFYLLCTIAVIALVYAWFRYRLEQALKIERMRVQISSDLHDDVGTLLSGLAMQSEVLELTAPEKDKSKLRRIGEISRDAMTRMRDTVWAIDARKDKLENLLDRMREHAEETLAPRGIRFTIEAEHLSLRQNLPTYIRQNLYLIYKEAVTNAAKHSNGDTISVSLKKSAALFEMRICDNGTTEEKGWKTTGQGVSNMQMRAEKIGGKVEISREDGYCVVLYLKTL